MLKAVQSYCWPYEGIPFVVVRVRAAVLADRVGIAMHSWEEPGLGQANGFGFSTKQRTYLAKELTTSVQFHGMPGPGIFADALEIVNVGVTALIDDITTTLELSPEEVQTADASEIEREAARLVAEFESQESKLWTQAAREGLPRFRFFRRSTPPAVLDVMFRETRLEAKWLRLKSMMQPGDQLWPFSLSVRSRLGLREGYSLLRRGKPVGGIVTIVS